MGCNSYADFVVEPNLAKSPKVVISFLEELSKTVKPKADEVSWPPHYIYKSWHFYDVPVVAEFEN